MKTTEYMRTHKIGNAYERAIPLIRKEVKALGIQLKSKEDCEAIMHLCGLRHEHEGNCSGYCVPIDTDEDGTILVNHTDWVVRWRADNQKTMISIYTADEFRKVFRRVQQPDPKGLKEAGIE